MYIEKLVIENFRGFKEADITFSKRPTTAFIGVNGAGKTAILDCICKALYIFYVKLAKKRGPYLGFEGYDIHNGTDKTENTLYLSCKGQKVVLGFGIERERLSIKRSHTHSGIDIVSELLDMEKDEGRKTGLPLILYYPTHRVVPAPSFKSKREILDSPLHAYHKAFGGSVNFNDFFEWFRNEEDFENETRLRENPKYRSKQLSAVREAISTFIPEFRNLRVQRHPRAELLVEKKGVTLSIHQLSHGERLMLSLVGDIARRLSIANPNAKDPLEGEGIILIDEIELHLHPGWQRKVIEGLEDSFPNCQFVVSTHSPQVLSKVMRESVFAIEDNKVYPHVDSYGRDSNWLLEVLMGVSQRPDNIQQEIERFMELIRANKLDEAEELQKHLEQTIGRDDPIFVKADILIRRMRRRK